MLIKIKNDKQCFTEQVDLLKTRFSVGTSSGAATQAIYGYISLEQRYDELQSKFDDLLSLTENVREALLKRSESHDVLNSFRDIEL
jgi:glutamate-1-semialdehyde aminotransferase